MRKDIIGIVTSMNTKSYFQGDKTTNISSNLIS